MSEFSGLLDRIAAQQIDERIAHTRAHHRTGPRRPRGRRALAHRLHALADRLEA